VKAVRRHATLASWGQVYEVQLLTVILWKPEQARSKKCIVQKFFSSLAPTVEHRADFLSFMIIFTDGRTPWTSDQLVTRYLPKHRTARTQNKRIQTPNIHALCGFRTHDPGFGANEDSTCPRPVGYRDRLCRIDLIAVQNTATVVSLCVCSFEVSSQNPMWAYDSGSNGWKCDATWITTVSSEQCG
jgi:hypothetical protein